MTFRRKILLLGLSIFSFILRFVLNCLLILPVMRTMKHMFSKVNMKSAAAEKSNGYCPNESKSRHSSGNEIRSRHSSDNGSGHSTVSPRPGLLQRSDSIVHFTHKTSQSKPSPYRTIKIQVNKSLRESKLKALQAKSAKSSADRLKSMDVTSFASQSFNSTGLSSLKSYTSTDGSGDSSGSPPRPVKKVSHKRRARTMPEITFAPRARTFSELLEERDMVIKLKNQNKQ